ncbi:Cubilin [Manis pentadactyla]|nr:Cubilin [Manis pentadactyla]
MEPPGHKSEELTTTQNRKCLQICEWTGIHAFQLRWPIKGCNGHSDGQSTGSSKAACLEQHHLGCRPERQCVALRPGISHGVRRDLIWELGAVQSVPSMSEARDN